MYTQACKPKKIFRSINKLPFNTAQFDVGTSTYCWERSYRILIFLLLFCSPAYYSLHACTAVKGFIFCSCWMLLKRQVCCALSKIVCLSVPFSVFRFDPHEKCKQVIGSGHLATKDFHIVFMFLLAFYREIFQTWLVDSLCWVPVLLTCCFC